jgi:hypothetical protein
MKKKKAKQSKATKINKQAIATPSFLRRRFISNNRPAPKAMIVARCTFRRPESLTTVAIGGILSDVGQT